MQSAIKRLGTQVMLPDGRVGTVVFNSLIGVGIKWGYHTPNPDDFVETLNLFSEKSKPADWPWYPDALLRDKSMTEQLGIECVGEDSTVKIIRIGLGF